MSRWNRNSERERKEESQKHPASNDRNSRRENRFTTNRDKDDLSTISGLNRHRLNDLYERSSI
jgi:hypothetical protein